MDVSGNHDVRADETVIVDRRIVTDMIPAPERDVAADADKRLDGIVFENEAVVAWRMVRQERTAAPDVADQIIATGSCGGAYLAARTLFIFA